MKLVRNKTEILFWHFLMERVLCDVNSQSQPDSRSLKNKSNTTSKDTLLTKHVILKKRFFKTFFKF